MAAPDKGFKPEADTNSRENDTNNRENTEQKTRETLSRDVFELTSPAAARETFGRTADVTDRAAFRKDRIGELELIKSGLKDAGTKMHQFNLDAAKGKIRP